MGAGGLRCGAGRPGWRSKCEDFLPLDVRTLARRGNLQPGAYLDWQWSCGDMPLGSVGVRASNDHLRLIYTWTPRGAPARSMDCRVSIETTRCNFGGARPWFRCPRCDCRRAVLYGVGSDGRFGCRGCMGLAYSCETESKWSRANRRVHKLRAQLGEKGARPDRMRLSTYARTLSRFARASEAWQAIARSQVAALSRRRA
jgi:hypothetical protein